MSDSVAAVPGTFVQTLIRSLVGDSQFRTRKRPGSLAYDVDDIPPAYLTWVLAFQHVLAMSIGWIYVIVVVDAMSGSRADAQSLLRVSMIASGITTILQARNGVFGSGYLCPASCSLTYLAPTILAGRMGGFPLIFGMTAINGAFTGILSRFLRYLRILFPPDVTGLIVSIVGIQLVAIGCPKLLGRSPAHPTASTDAALLGFITLIAMIAPTVWSRGKLKLFPILIGLFVGYVAALLMGTLHWADIRAQWAQPLFGIPHRVAWGMAFRFELLLPFLVIGISATLKTVGDLTLCQKINDADWKRTEMKPVSGGILAGSLCTAFAGLCGGMGQSTFSSNVGLSMATGATSRSIAMPIGAILILLAFFPKLAALFAAIPQPVMGAVLVYVACFMILGGMQVVTSRMLDARKTFAIGIALVFGLSVEMVPGLYRGVPPLVQPLFASSLSLSTVLVVLLNLLTRIGIARERSIVLSPAHDDYNEVTRFMEEQGAMWGMRKEVATRAAEAISECLVNIHHLGVTSPVLTRARFNELNLNVVLRYDGPAMEFPANPPGADELVNDPAALVRLSGFLIQWLADRVAVSAVDGHCHVRLHFDH